MAAKPESLPELHPVSGVRLGTAAAAIRYRDRDDLVVIECGAGSSAAAVFTRNRFVAAPVQVARSHLATASPRALLINAGNANAGTGEAGFNDALSCCAALAEELGCAVTEILPFSTGVIGEPLPVQRVVSGLPACLDSLAEDNWAAAARAIMTTDTVPKASTRKVSVGNDTVTVTGIAKGAGMIHPDMATLLTFVATDAAVAPQALQAMLEAGVAMSLNRITIDGDTSTNDSCVLLASGAGVSVSSGTEAYDQLFAAVAEVLTDLARAVVRDGEGASKFIAVRVEGGASEADCLAVANTVALSPLVKTACFASDPNWGRILAAVGRAPVAELEVSRVAIWLDQVRVVQHGGLDPDYREAAGAGVMQQDEFTIRVDLGAGTSTAEVWTCDLSYDYVKINAEYRS
jgi:glutamate N-acetyltransferase/amino-acid N-acetyltransferase